MRDVTADEVHKSVIENNISIVNHHDCCICGVWVKYMVVDGCLFFNASCGCSTRAPDPRKWDDAADWINMQSNPENKKSIAKQFGIDLE
jgi:hypothetical protein